MEPSAPGETRWPPPPAELPKSSAAKTIGILNIVFGSILLLCVICSGLNAIMQSALGPMFGMQQQQLQQAMQQEQQQRLEQLQEQEKAAKEEKEKQELRAKQQALRAQPVPKMPDFAKLAEDVRFLGYTIADVVSGFVLNVLMLISGIALVRYKEWGRKTALWVAALKIVRLVALNTFLALVLVPHITRGFTSMFQEMFDEMAKAAPPGQRMPGQAEITQMGTMIGVMMTVFAVAMVILGVIYPVVVLIVLSRPRVKASCVPEASSGGPTVAGGNPNP